MGSKTDPRRGTRIAGWAALALAGVACGDPPVIPIEVTTGHEEGVFGDDPAITLVEIVATSPEGEVQLQTSAAPGEDFTLGEAPETTILTFELTGKTADGAVVARGRSVSIPVGALDVDILPLFIQRLGGFARPPGGLVRAHVNAPGGVLGERFLIATGGDSALGEEGADPASGDYYDLLGMEGSESGNLPRAARSLVVRGSLLYLFDDAGGSLADLQGGTTSDLTPPDGFEFGEISGGRAIEASNGLTFVVGATRPSGATDAVLVVDPSGVLSFVRLTTPRQGAAALWVEGVGLVVAGGSIDGPGVEVIRDDGVTNATLPFPSDDIEGSAGVVSGEQQMVLFGGRALDATPGATRVVDLRCVAECVPDPVESVALPEVVARGVGFAVTDAATGAQSTVVVGQDDAGETLAFRVDLGAETVTALPLREPRSGATAVGTPNGLLAIVGGVTTSGAAARSIELLFPE